MGCRGCCRVLPGFVFAPFFGGGWGVLVCLGGLGGFAGFLFFAFAEDWAGFVGFGGEWVVLGCLGLFCGVFGGREHLSGLSFPIQGLLGPLKAKHLSDFFAL